MPTHSEMMDKLRRGEPGSYRFHLIEGDSYLALEHDRDEARALALKYNGTFHLSPGSDTQEEAFIVEI